MGKQCGHRLVLVLFLALALVVAITTGVDAHPMPEDECAADANYKPAIPPDALRLGPRIGAGTEKVIYQSVWAGTEVAAMEILGHSKMRDVALQRRSAVMTHHGDYSRLTLPPPPINTIASQRTGHLAATLQS
jgi:hypothetical protein